MTSTTLQEHTYHLTIKAVVTREWSEMAPAWDSWTATIELPEPTPGKIRSYQGQGPNEARAIADALNTLGDSIVRNGYDGVLSSDTDHPPGDG